jgi:hypothetical protein
MKTSTNTKKLKLPFKKSKTQCDNKRSCSKRRVNIESNKPYTFENIQANPTQFCNKFEQLLNFNTKMNQGLSFDIDGLERNLSKLQHMSKVKSNKDHDQN